jgi:exosortase
MTASENSLSGARSAVKHGGLVLTAWIAGFVACFYPTFAWLHYRYSAVDSYYSHGYIIPLVSAYLVYTRREVIRKAEIGTNLFGLVLVVLALAVHVIATMADINFASGFSMLAYLCGSCLFIWGTERTKLLAFPLLFLLFMFPLPGAVIDWLGIPTKSVAATIGLSIVDVLGIPFFREGFRIEMENSVFVVGTPCNGMKSLISFAALGVIACHMAQVSWSKRVLMLFLLYPLAMILNGARIAILVVIAHTFGAEKAAPESLLHDLSGLSVFLVGMVVLFGFIHLRGRRGASLPDP